MNSTQRAFGQSAEAEAEQYLRRKGYRILSRNLRSSAGELDIVAQDGAVLVFIEVKARRTSLYGGAMHAVDGRKQERLIRLAAQYLAHHRLREQACRFDVMLYQVNQARQGDFDHIENAFEVPGEDLRW
ncbi:MAG: YraN family protein [Nitrospiraceae bacterium]